MAEEFKYTLTFDSRATGSGAEETKAAVEAVAESAKDAAEAVKEVGMGGMPGLADEVKKATTGFGGMLNETNKTTAAVDKLAASEKQVAKTADEIVQRLKEMVDEAKEAAGAVEDVAGAADNAGEALRGADPQLGGLINIEKAKVAANIAGRIGDIGAQARKISKELSGADKELSETFGSVATGLESLSSGLGLAAQGFAVGGPFGAAVGGTIGLLTGPLKSAFTGMIEDLARATQAEKNAEEAVKKLARAREEFAAQIRNEKNAAFFDAETQALLRSVRALESRSRIAQGQREADNRAADVFGQGATPTQRIDTNLARQITEIEAGVALALDKARLAEQAAQLARAEASQASTQQGDDSPATISAKKAAEAAERAAEQAQEQVAEISAIAATQKQKLLADAAEEFKGLGVDVGDSITENAKVVKQQIEAIAAAQGGKLSADIGGALGSLTKLLEDSIPDSQQTAQLAQAMNIAAGSRDALNSGLSEFFRTSAATQTEMERKLSFYIQEVKNLKAKVEGLGSR